MTSLLTNNAATAALANLRSVSSTLTRTSDEVSSGLKISKASDNAAYWSISTSMKSDRGAVSAAKDTLALGEAKVDVAYNAMVQTEGALSQIKDKLVAAKEPSVDKSELQNEISQLAQSTVDIAKSASFNGVNWLNTNIPYIYETTPENRSDQVVSSFTRSADGSVSVGTIAVDQVQTSLYNADGGGILQGDPRSPLTIGGIRWPTVDENGVPGYTNYSGVTGGAPGFTVNFKGPTTFSPTDSVSFDVTLDGDNPAQGLPNPQNPGITTQITINRSVVDAALPGANGKISNYADLISVFNTAFDSAGIGAQAAPEWKDENSVFTDRLQIYTTQSEGLDGSQIQISNVTPTSKLGDLHQLNVYGSLGSDDQLAFQQFKIYKDVSISFDFAINGEAPQSYTIDRSTIDTILGKDADGVVGSADDWAKILQGVITRPNTIIQSRGSSVEIRSDPNDDRRNGNGTSTWFTNVAVNIEPIPQTGLSQIDVKTFPKAIDYYLKNVESQLGRVISGAAMLGSLKERIAEQSDFASSTMDDLTSGIGKLVDANMEDASAKLSATQVQQQLAIRSLSIANQAPQIILSLYQ